MLLLFMFPFCITFFVGRVFIRFAFRARRSETDFLFMCDFASSSGGRVAEISRERCLPILRYQSVIARVTGMLFACEAAKTIENWRKKCAATAFAFGFICHRERERFHRIRARIARGATAATRRSSINCYAIRRRFAVLIVDGCTCSAFGFRLLFFFA